MYNQTNSNLFKVDDYVLLTGKEGYIRYIGQREHRYGKWYGIELIRGSGVNDGSEYGKPYFCCKDGKGIFVRLSGIKCKINQSPKTKTKSKRQNLKKSQFNKYNKPQTIENITNIKPSVYIKYKRQKRKKREKRKQKKTKSVKHNKYQKSKQKNTNKPKKTAVSKKKKSGTKTRRSPMKKSKSKQKNTKKCKPLDAFSHELNCHKCKRVAVFENNKSKKQDSNIKPSMCIKNKKRRQKQAKFIECNQYRKSKQKINHTIASKQLKYNDVDYLLDTSESEETSESQENLDEMKENEKEMAVSYSEISVVYYVENGKEYIQTTKNFEQIFVSSPDTPMSFESNKDLKFAINFSLPVNE